MSIFAQLNQEAARRELQFLVIGGHAVNVHSYSRQTYDLDLLISKDRAPEWTAAVSSLGYTFLNAHPTFLQFTAPSPKDWPIDFMLVNQRTWTGLWSEAVEAGLGGVTIKVPSLRHLIALKLHVLKQGLRHRVLKDLNDVVQLVELNRVDVRADEFRRLCERYGNLKLYEDIVRAIEPG
ncbi:MAG: nucleotidyltransferase family protein [Verrucomicrobia bacterium]|nr:nucleotidyltransferase family protein [Verrucomicrobiota bacterium]